jgi:hypothetical protein
VILLENIDHWLPRVKHLLSLLYPGEVEDGSEAIDEAGNEIIKNLVEWYLEFPGNALDMEGAKEVTELLLQLHKPEQSRKAQQSLWDIELWKERS